MEIKNKILINARRNEVFSALNDPAVLKQSIPGCQNLEKISDSELRATVVAKIGPIKAKFTGTAKLSDINAPESYSISGEGQGGSAGFATGSAFVELNEEDESTVLSYTVKAEVGGKLAQLGSRLIEGTTKHLANEFFTKFSEVVVPVKETGASLNMNKQEIGHSFKLLELLKRPLAWLLIGLGTFLGYIYFWNGL